MEDDLYLLEEFKEDVKEKDFTLNVDLSDNIIRKDTFDNIESILSNVSDVLIGDIYKKNNEINSISFKKTLHNTNTFIKNDNQFVIENSSNIKITDSVISLTAPNFEKRNIPAEEVYIKSNGFIGDVRRGSIKDNKVKLESENNLSLDLNGIFTGESVCIEKFNGEDLYYSQNIKYCENNDDALYTNFTFVFSNGRKMNRISFEDDNSSSFFIKKLELLDNNSNIHNITNGSYSKGVNVFDFIPTTVNKIYLEILQKNYTPTYIAYDKNEEITASEVGMYTKDSTVTISPLNKSYKNSNNSFIKKISSISFFLKKADRAYIKLSKFETKHLVFEDSGFIVLSFSKERVIKSVSIDCFERSTSDHFVKYEISYNNISYKEISTGDSNKSGILKYIFSQSSIYTKEREGVIITPYDIKKIYIKISMKTKNSHSTPLINNFIANIIEEE